MGKKDKLTLFWLAEKGLIRFKFLFILKLLIIILWGLLIFNHYIIFTQKIIPIKNNLYTWIVGYQFIFANFLALLFILTITMFTFRLRKDEFGLYRCSGSTRKEIFLLIINESLISSLFSIIIILIIEAFLLYYFRLPILKFLKITLIFPFILELLKAFIFTSIIVLIGLFICYLPFGFYYTFKDPYNIVKY